MATGGASKRGTMIVFIDAEFTDLLHPELLSIGLVAMDGREHYVELDLTTVDGQARVKASSDFVRYGGILDMWGMVILPLFSGLLKLPIMRTFCLAAVPLTSVAQTA